MHARELKPSVIVKAKQLYEANREDIDSIATHGFSFAKVIAQAIKKLASENTQEEIEKKKREMQQTLRKAGFFRRENTWNIDFTQAFNGGFASIREFYQRNLTFIQWCQSGDEKDPELRELSSLIIGVVNNNIGGISQDTNTSENEHN